MRNRGLSLIVVALVALASHAETQHMPRGTATDGSRAEVEATIEMTALADDRGHADWGFGQAQPDHRGLPRDRGPQIAYLVVRIDPHKVVPAGYGAK
jgi:hypothetical protein